MLILHRKVNEALCIGDGIRVVVLEVDARGARLGIEAPAHVTILRDELRRQVAEENRRASLGASGSDERGDLEELLGPGTKVDRSTP